MGMIVEIYRSSLGDCTGGGISSQARSLTIVNVEGPFTPTTDRPAAMLVPGVFANTANVVPAINVGTDDEPEWERIPSNTTEYAGPMFGGNLADTSDSRWCDAVAGLTGNRFQHAVPIHDRTESWDLYRSISRD